MKTKFLVASILIGIASQFAAAEPAPAGKDSQQGTIILDPNALSKASAVTTGDASRPGPATEPMAQGPFQPSWKSLMNYQTPEWFRDAKFGIFAHWGPQCQPEASEGSGWYARNLYVQGSKDYDIHVQKYGHPSKVGFKDVCNDWKGEKFDPDKLLALYKQAGAKYLVAMANHHDNFDLWDSKYQPWNSVRVGPKKNIVNAWAKAARSAGLHFGVSVHADPAWDWYETAQGTDKTGPLAGVTYDGKSTKSDGKGQWWEGLDPQDLYAQDHQPGKRQVYCDKFYNRTLDLINRYQPDLLYFDDRTLPLATTEAYGLQIAAHLYNSSIARNHGCNEAVMNTKGLDENQQRCLVYDMERARPDRVLSLAFQAETCIGNWHYDPSIYEKHKYRTASAVIALLCDVVSKNGNLLLSVPIRGNGEIDEDETTILQEIGQWMNINGEAIHATRPWKEYGEGPSTVIANNERQTGWRGKLNQLWDWRGQPYTAEDSRFTQSKDGKTLYAIILGVPSGPVRIKSLGNDAKLLENPIASIALLGSDSKLDWKQEADALVIQPPTKWPDKHAAVFKMRFKQ